MVDIPGGTIRYQGLFDFDGLYNVLVNWFKTYRYWFHEDTYKHKVPTPLGAEQEMGWVAEKEVTSYYKYIIRVHIQLWDMTEVKVIKEGKEKVLTNARLEIKFAGKVVVDWQKRFEKNKFTRMLRNFYNKYMIRREIESVWVDTLYYRMWNLHAVAKKYIDMQTKWHEFAGYIGEYK